MVNPACTLLESCHERQGKQVQVTCILSSAHYRTFLAKGRISGFLQSYSKHFGVRANPIVSLTRVVPFNCGSGLKQILEKGSLSKRVVVELWSLFCFEFFRIFWVQMDADLWLGRRSKRHLLLRVVLRQESRWEQCYGDRWFIDVIWCDLAKRQDRGWQRVDKGPELLHAPFIAASCATLQRYQPNPVNAF